jgi:hypothetical protein
MAEDESKQYDPIKHKHIFVMANVMFVVASLIACMFEAILIQRIWIKPRMPVDGLTAFTLQFVGWVPALMILSLRLMVGKQLKKGGISPSFAFGISLNLGILLMMVYLAFMQLLEFAPR